MISSLSLKSVDATAHAQYHSVLCRWCSLVVWLLSHYFLLLVYSLLFIGVDKKPLNRMAFSNKLNGPVGMVCNKHIPIRECFYTISFVLISRKETFQIRRYLYLLTDEPFILNKPIHFQNTFFVFTSTSSIEWMLWPTARYNRSVGWKRLNRSIIITLKIKYFQMNPKLVWTNS